MRFSAKLTNLLKTLFPKNNQIRNERRNNIKKKEERRKRNEWKGNL